MADYTVSYNIKTNTFNTIQQLTELARVAGKMHNAANQINKVTLAIEQLNKACAGSGKGIAIFLSICPTCALSSKFYQKFFCEKVRLFMPSGRVASAFTPMLRKIFWLSAETGFDDIDDIFAEFLKLIDHVDIECAERIVIFVIVHLTHVFAGE